MSYRLVPAKLPGHNDPFDSLVYWFMQSGEQRKPVPFTGAAKNAHCLYRGLLKATGKHGGCGVMTERGRVYLFRVVKR